MSMVIVSTWLPVVLRESTIYTGWLPIYTTEPFSLIYSKQRASDELRQMADEALEYHHAGLTEDFPLAIESNPPQFPPQSEPTGTLSS